MNSSCGLIVISIEQEKLQYILINRLTTAVGALLLIYMLTNAMSPAQYGELSLVLTLFNLFTALLMAPLGQGFARTYVTSIKLNRQEDFFLMVKAIYKKVALIFITAFLILNYSLEYNLGEASYLLGLVLLYAFLFGVHDHFTSLHNMAQSWRFFALIAVLEVVAKLSFLALIIWCFPITNNVIFLTYLAALSLVLIGHKQNFQRLVEQGSKRNQTKSDLMHWQKRTLQVACPAVVWGVAQWIHQSADKWALFYFNDTADVGRYAVLHQLVYLPYVMLMGVFLTWYMPKLYQYKNDGAPIRRLVEINILVCALAVTVCAFFGQYLLDLIVGSKYVDLAFLMPFVVLGSGLYCIGDVLSQRFMQSLKTGHMLFVRFSSCAFGVLFSILGAKLGGISGVVFGLVGYGIIYLSVCLLASSNLERKGLPS